jgi:hypothetical protein
MTGRALLNRVYARAVEAMDADRRVEFDQLLADPAAAQRTARQRALNDLRAAGGDVG